MALGTRNKPALNKEVSKEFGKDLSDYNNLAKEVNRELEDKKRFVFIKRDFAIKGCKEIKERLDKINSLYTKLTNEINKVRTDNEMLISKKRIKKLTEIRYWDDKNIEIRIPAYF